MFGTKKTRIVWLLDGEKQFDDLFSRFDKIPACERQTDGRTCCDSVVRAMHSHRTVQTDRKIKYIIDGDSF